MSNPNMNVNDPVQVTNANDTAFIKSSARVSRKIPAEVRMIAAQCQNVMFETTGLIFFNVQFQIPHSPKEALRVMHSGIGNVDKLEFTKKLHFLAWAHMQMLHAELAALGYKHIQSSLRIDRTVTRPPPVEDWFTLVSPHTAHDKPAIVPASTPASMTASAHGGKRMQISSVTPVANQEKRVRTRSTETIDLT